MFSRLFSCMHSNKEKTLKLINKQAKDSQSLNNKSMTLALHKSFLSCESAERLDILQELHAKEESIKNDIKFQDNPHQMAIADRYNQLYLRLSADDPALKVAVQPVESVTHTTQEQAPVDKQINNTTAQKTVDNEPLADKKKNKPDKQQKALQWLGKRALKKVINLPITALKMGAMALN